MAAAMPRASIREGDALLRVLEAYIETLQAQKEILKRRLTTAEARAAQGTAKEEEAIATKKVKAPIAEIETERGESRIGPLRPSR